MSRAFITSSTLSALICSCPYLVSTSLQTSLNRASFSGQNSRTSTSPESSACSPNNEPMVQEPFLFPLISWYFCELLLMLITKRPSLSDSRMWSLSTYINPDRFMCLVVAIGYF
ncbi:Hypothetical_protein [Hexamita inflata]|uniref:Hypothetical_protein n=1 Tax=Hexamita inflata TaxID=28002 RepID=A0AA86P993_9EUKA|nr:Hypothetical protein HINF_LOCUS20978 [Hexamita inflata]